MQQDQKLIVASQINVGNQAPKLMLDLLEMNDCIETLTFATYYPSPSLEQRLEQIDQSPNQRKIIGKNSLRKAAKATLPYWQAILSEAWSKEQFDLLVKEALRHDEEDEIKRRFTVPAKVLTQEYMYQMLDDLPNNKVLAIYSICRLRDGASAHIPMMDFSCIPTAHNLEMVNSCIKAIGLRGAILESGRSYHFYGFDLLNHNEWIKFMAKSLLLAPNTDSRYIAHRLLGGACVLRISASERKPVIPFVSNVLL